jgi:hypothetical protein
MPGERPETEWLSGTAAQRVIGCTWYYLQRLALLGRVRTLIEPGGLVRFRRDDCLQITPEYQARLAKAQGRAKPGPKPRHVEA